MITPHKTITQNPPPPSPAAVTFKNFRNRHTSSFDGLPPAWVGSFDTNNAGVRRAVAAGQLEIVDGDGGPTPNQVFLDLLAAATQDAPDGRTPEQCVRFAKQILSEFDGKLTYDPRAKWSDALGADGVGYWGVIWGKRFHCDMSRATSFQAVRSFASKLAAASEAKAGRHTLGGGIFSKPE